MLAYLLDHFDQVAVAFFCLVCCGYTALYNLILRPQSFLVVSLLRHRLAVPCEL